jgi:hypothetical protein
MTRPASAIPDAELERSKRSRVRIIVAATLAMIAVVFLFPPIPQSQLYHEFADRRTIFGVPNFLNVISNVLFLFVGVLGVRAVLGDGNRDSVAVEDAGAASLATARSNFIDPRERRPYFVFFVSVAITAFGSAYYHWKPSDGTLLWDRVPMAIGFMALLAATIGERIGLKAGARSLWPLAALGAGSVIYWSVTQSRGVGDLRPYVLVQFGSVIVLLLLVWLFPARYTRGADLVIALGIYAFAKMLEAADRPVFALGGFVSGHTLKHIAAAFSAYWILRMILLREPRVDRRYSLE